jgi:hypothetical protein
MSTPESRLDVLRRQRALVQQNLAWLDREIAAEQAQTPSATPLNPAATPDLTRPALPPTAAIADADADAIIEHYRSGEPNLKADVRRGCLLYATGAFVLLIVVVLGLYVLFRH